MNTAIEGSTTNPTGNYPGGVLAQPTNPGGQQSMFAAMGEFGVTADYALWSQFRVSFGYPSIVGAGAHAARVILLDQGSTNPAVFEAIAPYETKLTLLRGESNRGFPGGHNFIHSHALAGEPFEVTPLQPRRDASLTSHALSPAAVMQVFVDLQQAPPPLCSLMAIRGERFELGEPPSDAALRHLAEALDWGLGWIGHLGGDG